MIKNSINLARRFGSKIKSSVDAKTGQVFVAVASLASVAPSFAAGESIDTTEALAYIAAGLTAALVVSAAMTGARIGVKGSKLPRSGA
ncbi:hypothetical protein [Luteibacter sp. 22Crub2.1]|uniref:hypothetical protein n=1 Tax=Luteibacter sp. 22Crub2.1 TaxID=1283288 RepID=UPI0009D17640|nr:hypothetical protein [Luteibacter sp. 22Crub2.1]SKB73759.1 hypothetical protein SAMN05660880_02374 [Luteibacter sp. 22Crub2.1]